MNVSTEQHDRGPANLGTLGERRGWVPAPSAHECIEVLTDVGRDRTSTSRECRASRGLSLQRKGRLARPPRSTVHRRRLHTSCAPGTCVQSCTSNLQGTDRLCAVILVAVEYRTTRRVSAGVCRQYGGSARRVRRRASQWPRRVVNTDPGALPCAQLQVTCSGAAYASTAS